MDENTTATGEASVPVVAGGICCQFTLAQIQSATSDFSDEYLLGRGGFGKVYDGVIDHGGEIVVAIKRRESTSLQGEREFLTEIETLTQLRHDNLVSLIGYCNENGEMILVYEYMACGTLADHLFGSISDNTVSCLTWYGRLNICIEVGRGLDYLHTGRSLIHRDVKASNILLDENFRAKVSDFGLAKYVSRDKFESHVSTVVKGTWGYIDPCYLTTGRLTKEADTYAFGVMLLETVTGRSVRNPGLILWAREKISKGKARHIVDSNLKGEMSEDSLKAFVGIAERCLHCEPEKRPTMAQVVLRLESALQQQERSSKAKPPRPWSWDAFWNRRKPSSSVLVQVPFEELKSITNEFLSVIGEGSYGPTLYGVLKSGQAVAVKKLDSYRRQDQDFSAQVSVLSTLMHANVVELLGFCVCDRKHFLIYEYATNGSLHDILHGKGVRPDLVLSWPQRVKIALDAAKGLKFIHDRDQAHLNIKSSNILLFDDNPIAKVADVMFSNRSPSVRSGYEAPENRYPMIRQGSWRIGDVYSFGVVLLELFTGRKAFDPTLPRGQQYLVQWVFEIAAFCVQSEAESRPDMQLITEWLQDLLPTSWNA